MFSCVGVLALLVVSGATAQVGNEGLVVRDGSLGAEPAGVVRAGVDPNGAFADYLIGEDLGRRVNDNLFHSFEQFSLGTEEVATFTGSEGIDTIISRVTGGAASDLDGTLRSTIEGADLYLLNPAGVLFGPHSRLDLRGSFHVTTADALRFANGESFEARAGGSVPILAFEPPTAFGFLHEAPAGIAFAQDLDRPPCCELEEGTGLEVPEGGTLSIIGGDITLSDSRLAAPAGSLKLVSVTSSGELGWGSLDADLESFDGLGEIHLRESRMSTTGSAGGQVVIRGGRLEIVDSQVFAETLGDVDGIGVDVAVDELTMDRSGDTTVIITSSYGSGAPGSIDIEAKRVHLKGGELGTWGFGPGDAGSISVKATESVSIGFVEEVDKAPSGLRAIAFGEGETGDIVVTTPRLEMSGRQQLPPQELRQVAWIMNTSNGGRVGDVVIAVDTLRLMGHARIDAGGSFIVGGSDSNAGSISINATELVSMSGAEGSIRRPEITAESGSVSIQSPILRLEDGGILTDSRETRPAGRIDLDIGEQLTLLGEAVIQSTGLDVDAGSIAITTPLLEIGKDSLLSTGTTSRFQTSLSAGDIELAVGTLRLAGGIESEVADLFGRSPMGRSGEISISASEGVEITGGALKTSAQGRARAGRISLAAPRVDLRQASIASEQLAAGDGGDISIVGGQFAEIRDSRISARVEEGTGGNVTLEAGQLISLLDASEVLADAPQGQGGRIEITSPIFIKSVDSVLDASGGIEGGDVIINSPDQILVNQVTPLSAEFLDASSLLLASCGARNSGERSGSFTVARWPGLPLFSEGPLLAFDPIGGSVAAFASQRDALPPVAANARPPISLEPAQRALEQGVVALRGGRLAAAQERLQEASSTADRAGDVATQGDALRGLAQARQVQGEYAESIAPLEAALKLARVSGDAAREAAALGNLGNAYVALREEALAERHLTQAVERVRELDAPALASALLNNVGNHRALVGDYEEAGAAYEESALRAREARLPLREAQALANAALVALRTEQYEAAAHLLIRARLRTRGVEVPREEMQLLIQLGRSYAMLAERSPAHRREGLTLARRVLLEAHAQAEELGDERSLSFAQGNLGSLYQQEARAAEALYLTREALRTAERARAPDLLARWHGQEGEILWAAGQQGSAFEVYRRAVDLTEDARPELRARYGARDGEFRQAIEPIYLRLVDALLKRAGQETDTEESHALLVEARSTVERSKAAELRDYFQDACIAELEARAEPLEAVSRTAAVVYPILLPDRLEILLSGPSGIEQHTVPVTGDEVDRTARAFRVLAEDRSTRQYLRPAQQLYDWLVRPYAKTLVERGVDTLVFVPGGALRTIPLAALHDGEAFLVESFAVAVTPSLDLLAPKALDIGRSGLLLAGVGEPVGGYLELANVPAELMAIQQLYGGELMLDGDFELARFEEALRERPPGVVHLASHVEFTGDPRTSYVLTHDGRLTVERLTDLVSARRFGEQPLELLLLSACRTAAGDDRASLGLAGLAVRAGARSAMGSLWSVDDVASATLLKSFYRELGAPGVSKAQALRRAERALLADGRFEHPFYWAPFQLINNWL